MVKYAIPQYLNIKRTIREVVKDELKQQLEKQLNKKILSALKKKGMTA